MIGDLTVGHSIAQPSAVGRPGLFGEDHEAVLVLEDAVDCGGVGGVFLGEGVQKTHQSVDVVDVGADEGEGW